MDDLNKKENISFISDPKDHIQVQMEEIIRDALGIVDEYEHDSKKVKNKGDSPSVDSFSGPIPFQGHGTSVHSVNSETQKYVEGLYSHKNPLKEAHKKSIHAKITENSGLFFLFCVIVIKCIPRAYGEEF